MTAAGSKIELWDMSIGQASSSVSVGNEGGFVFGGERNEVPSILILTLTLTLT